VNNLGLSPLIFLIDSASESSSECLLFVKNLCEILEFEKHLDLECEASRCPFFARILAPTLP
jgi:hypothetical protein